MWACVYISYYSIAFNVSAYLVQKEEMNVRLDLSIQTKLSYIEKEERKEREKGKDLYK